MIIGIGSDIIDIRRIEEAIARHGERFKNRIFTETEIAKSEKRGLVSAKLMASSYAKRFAAKEAFAKALGTGFSNRVFHKDIGVVNLPSGKPTIEAKNGALRALQYLAQNKPVNVHLSITDDYPWAQAFVVIEALQV